jgi:hypothetical protein
MKMPFQTWLPMRAVLGAFAILSGTASNSASIANGLAVVLVPIISAIVIYLWLFSLACKPDVDWSDPCSLTKPFFPLTRYPMRFWLLASVLFSLSGLVSAFREFLLCGSISPDSSMYFLSGISTLAALFLFWRSPALYRLRPEGRDMIGAASLAHRTLKHFSRYRDLSEGQEPLTSLPLNASERPLGIYRNEPDDITDAVLFTTEGLYVNRNGSWVQLLYRDIDRTLFPDSKSEVKGLKILRRDGSEFWLPVRGSKDGRFYDAFEVLRFLDRVQDDLLKG